MKKKTTIANKPYKKKYAQSENLNYKFPRNHYIRANEVRVIDEDGEQLGVLSKDEALRIAQEKELDLVVVAPNVEPPVCRIISWSKFKYEYSKKKKSSKNTGSELKEMWFKPLIDIGDMNHKIKRVREFLDEKHKVKITVRPGKNSRRLDKSVYFDVINKVLEELKEDATVETQPKLEGRNVYAIIRGNK